MVLTEVDIGEEMRVARNQQVFSLSVPSAQCKLWRWKN